MTNKTCLACKKSFEPHIKAEHKLPSICNKIFWNVCSGKCLSNACDNHFIFCDCDLFKRIKR